MADDAVFAKFLEIVERLGLSDAEIAVLARLATSTVRVSRLARRPPARAHCRQRIREFVVANEHAQTRTDLRLCA